ncbi:hypothetical protein [Amycolatopsis sp. NPDC051371]|uniref:hypothetical protein n=1 Tax=Amycolatopsis sp. NPDC051371 TaxID=3155800 RepID=UPI003413A514
MTGRVDNDVESRVLRRTPRSRLPETARGEYQGLAAAGSATAETVSPLIMTSLLIDGGQPGWLVLGTVFLLAGLGIVQAAKWSLRRPARLD